MYRNIISTYGIARCKIEDKSEIISIEDIPVLHELEIFSVNLQREIHNLSETTLQTPWKTFGNPLRTLCGHPLQILESKTFCYFRPKPCFVEDNLLTTLWILAGILSLKMPFLSPFCSKAVSWLKPSVRVGDGGPELEEMDDDDGEGGQELQRKYVRHKTEYLYCFCAQFVERQTAKREGRFHFWLGHQSGSEGHARLLDTLHHFRWLCN